MSAEEQAELSRLQAQRAQRTEWEERQELAALKAKRDKGETSGFSDFWEGVALSGMDMVYGVKDLVGAMDENDRATFDQVKKDASDSGFTTAGKVVSEIAQFAIPGGAVAKGVKGASKLKNLAKGVSGETLVAGTLAGARLPGEGETRAGNVAYDAAATAGGGFAGKVLAKTMRGLNKTPDAQKLLDEGVYLTPGQQAESKFIQNIETAAEVTPILARGTKAAKKEASESWNENILNKAAPAGTKITEIGTAGGAQLKKAVEAGYASAWKGVKPIDKALRGRLAGRLQKTRSKLGKKDRLVVDNVAADMERIGSAKGLDDILRREIGTAGRKKVDLRRVLEKTRRELRKVAPVDNKKALAKMDKNYPDFLTAEDAIIRAKQTGGVFTPAQLTMSSGKVGKKKAATGTGPLQEAADIGRETIGKKEGGQPLDFFRRLAGAAPSPPGMRGTGRMLMGDLAPQKAITRRLNESPTVRALRAGPSAAGLGYGTYLDEEQ